MSGIQDLWGREPAMIVAFVGAVISLAVAFGLQLSADQTAAIIAVVQILLGLITRSQVTPTPIASFPATDATPAAKTGA